MNFAALFPYYLSWHYRIGLKGLFSLWRTFTWFFWHHFSIPTLLKTLFMPFERLQDTGKKHVLDIEAMLSSAVTNFLMRIVGFLMRITVIALGLFVIILLSIFSLIFILGWILMPIALIMFLVMGLILLFKPPQIA